jgi:hypothetical protein
MEPVLIKNDNNRLINIQYRMQLSNTQIADNIITLLQKAKENEAFDDNTAPLKLFNKMVKAGMKGQTKINIKVSNKEPSAYNLFVKEKMSIVKAENPDMPGAEIFKKIGALWTELNPRKPKKVKDPSEPKAPKAPKEPKAPKKNLKTDKTDVVVDVKSDKSDKTDKEEIVIVPDKTDKTDKTDKKTKNKKGK